MGLAECVKFGLILFVALSCLVALLSCCPVTLYTLASDVLPKFALEYVSSGLYFILNFGFDEHYDASSSTCTSDIRRASLWSPITV